MADKNKTQANDIMIAKVFSGNVAKDNINSTVFFMKPKIIFFFIFVTVFTVLMIAFKIFYELNLYTWIAFAVLAALAFYNISAYIYAVLTIHKNSKYPVNTNNQGQFFFYRDRFIFSDKTCTTVIKYKYVDKAFETKFYFFIYVSNDKIYAVPKSGFMFPDERAVLSKFLSVKLEKKYKKR